MIKRSTWITVALLALFAALAWYTQQPDNLISKTLASGTPTAEALGTLISANDTPLHGMSIQNATGKVSTSN